MLSVLDDVRKNFEFLAENKYSSRCDMRAIHGLNFSNETSRSDIKHLINLRYQLVADSWPLLLSLKLLPQSQYHKNHMMIVHVDGAGNNDW